jgi:hypothetical protein
MLKLLVFVADRPSSVLFSCGTVAAFTEPDTAARRLNLSKALVNESTCGRFDRKEQLSRTLTVKIQKLAPSGSPGMIKGTGLNWAFCH